MDAKRGGGGVTDDIVHMRECSRIDRPAKVTLFMVDL